MRILLIEDSDCDAALISAYLEETGNEPPTRAGDLDAALSALARGSYDAVLLDLSLPDAHGDQLVTRVLPAVRDAALVVLSGDERDETARAALRRGALDYLSKGDVSAATLDRALRYALERRDARRAIAASEARYRRIVESLPDSMV